MATDPRDPAFDPVDDADLAPEGQQVADAADDVSAGTALGEVATLDPDAMIPLDEEDLAILDPEIEPVSDVLGGPDEDDAEAWFDEGRSGGRAP